MVLKTIDFLKKLELIYPDGFQVSIHHGILNSTKAIYKKEGLIFMFRTSDNFEFNKKMGYSENEFLNKYSDYNWIIEMIIS